MGVVIAVATIGAGLLLLVLPGGKCSSAEAVNAALGMKLVRAAAPTCSVSFSEPQTGPVAQQSFLEELMSAGRGVVALIIGDRRAPSFFNFAGGPRRQLHRLPLAVTGRECDAAGAAGRSRAGRHHPVDPDAGRAVPDAVGLHAIVLRQVELELAAYIVADNWATFFLACFRALLAAAGIGGMFVMLALAVLAGSSSKSTCPARARADAAADRHAAGGATGRRLGRADGGRGVHSMAAQIARALRQLGSRPSPDRALRAGQRAAAAAVAGIERGAEIARRPFAFAHKLQRADHRAHLRVQELRALARTTIMSPSRLTSSRSSVLSGDLAWHSAARNVVKSCLPRINCAAACIGSASSCIGQCQTRNSSRPGGRGD